MRRFLCWFTIGGLATYGLFHLVDKAVQAIRAMPAARRPAAPDLAPLTASQQPLVSALTRVLDEDGVPQAERWASAIVRASPTDDLGYLALVTAQIRRESRFLAPDLEWLYQQLVPDLVHDLGVTDPLRTIGPMQVQRWRLQDYFEQAQGRRLDTHTVKDMAVDIEAGVAACTAVLDRIVVDYFPDRRLRGWVHTPGPLGVMPQPPTLARDWCGLLAPERPYEALRQKLLSDLTAEPLALDGVPGERTRQLLAARPELAGEAALRAAWRARYGSDAPPRITPRISHEPRLAFVLADFHSGVGACRVAALQALLIDLFGVELACDGKWGPRTRAEVARLFGLMVPHEERRLEFVELLTTGHKTPWLRDQALAMARILFRQRHGIEAPDALVPDLWFDSLPQTLKGLGRISVEGYVAGSTAFYEDYLRRLSTYAGREVPAAAPRGD
jgi:hypothetical protein